MTLSVIFSQWIILTLTLIGFSYLSYLIHILIINLYSYLKYKKPVYTTKDKEIFLLEEKISVLQKQNAHLELQLQEITQNMIKQLQEKL